MGRARMYRLAVAAALFAGGWTAAEAAVESHTYIFRASAFAPVVNPASVSPYSTVTGKFTVTFDRLVSVPEGLGGIVLIRLDSPLGSPVAFRYDYIDAVDIGLVQIGGSENGIGGEGGISDDFNLGFQFTGLGAPQFGGFSYSNGSVVPNETFAASAGSVAEIAAVPEPASWILLIGGFGLVGGSARRRRTRCAPASAV